MLCHDAESLACCPQADHYITLPETNRLVQAWKVYQPDALVSGDENDSYLDMVALYSPG